MELCFLWKLMTIIIVIKTSQFIGINTFTFDITLTQPNRIVFVRNFGQIYVCPTIRGWSTTSESMKRNLIKFDTLFLNEKSELGVYMLKCGSHKIAMEVIDVDKFDIVIQPTFPSTLWRYGKYFFTIIIKPKSLNKDKTYTWKVYQTGGISKLNFERINNILFFIITKFTIPGNYSFALTMDFKIKEIKFIIKNQGLKQRARVVLPEAAEIMDSIENLNKYFMAFLILGFLMIIISVFVYICAILCTKREPIESITGHKNLLVEEECLMDDTTKECYKIMSNPMNREKDVELILEKARELGKNMPPLSRCGLNIGGHSDSSFNSMEKNPYGVSPDTIRYLRSKFSKGVCLNCVKLASQIILLNKIDCPSIHHICTDESCLNHGKPLRCLCAEMQINETARKTGDLYNDAITSKQCCQVQQHNNSNMYHDSLYSDICLEKLNQENKKDSLKRISKT